MTDIATLAAERRDTLGKGGSRALRRGGRVPAVIYGANKEPLAISLDGHLLGHELLRPGFFRRLYDLSVAGDKGKERVLARDVQRHPATDAPLHIDFLRISAQSEIAVAISVVFENEEESPGLKRGGVLNIVRHDIELLCPAGSIPDALRVDLTGLEIGDSIHISHIALPEGVATTITDRDFTIATVAAPTVVVEEVAEGEEEIEEIEGEEGEAEEGETEED